MNKNIEQMLLKYEVSNPAEKKNAIKEVVQEIALCGLSRAGLFKKAAFYGGTALRIFYGLDRFSEDLDFSLLEPDSAFNISDYFSVLQEEVNSFGLNLEISEKTKSVDSTIQSAFIKGNTREHILMFYPESTATETIAKNEIIKIKFEIDIDPPEGALFENRFQLLPSPYEVRLYDMPSLFAGKIHAVISRAWKSRTKGRDLYDYVFYLARNASVNMSHLRARLVDSKVLSKDDLFDIEVLKEMLNKRFDSIDYEQAKEDVKPFIEDKKSLEIWNAEFFKEITKTLTESM